MKTGIKCLLMVWVIIGGILTGLDAGGFILSKLLEKIGKPWKKLSEAYRLLSDMSIKAVIVDYVIMFFTWPILIIACIALKLLCNNDSRHRRGA